MPFGSTRILKAINHNLNASAGSLDAAADTARAKANLCVAEDELSKASRERAIGESLERQAIAHFNVAKRCLDAAMAAELRVIEQIRAANSLFSGIGFAAGGA